MCLRGLHAPYHRVSKVGQPSQWWYDFITLYFKSMFQFKVEKTAHRYNMFYYLSHINKRHVYVAFYDKTLWPTRFNIHIDFSILEGKTFLETNVLHYN